MLQILNGKLKRLNQSQKPLDAHGGSYFAGIEIVLESL